MARFERGSATSIPDPACILSDISRNCDRISQFYKNTVNNCEFSAYRIDHRDIYWDEALLAHFLHSWLNRQTVRAVNSSSILRFMTRHQDFES